MSKNRIPALGLLVAPIIGLMGWNQVFAAVTSVILPTGDGSFVQFVPSAGAVHYTLVDETPCNGITDYNRTTTVGHRDSYTTSLVSIPDGSTITQVAIKPCASRNTGGGGSATMNVFYRFNNSTSTDAGGYALAGTTPLELATTTYSSLSLDKTSTSTAEIGAVYSAGTRGVRLSRMSVVYTYNPLNAPTSLTGSATTSSAIRLTWTDNSLSEDGFEVERSLNAVDWTLVGTVSSTTTYFDNGLSPETTYYHRIRTFNAGVYSAYSNIATTTTTSLPPNAPSNLTATASSTVVTLNWTDNSSNETFFLIQRRIGTGIFFDLASTTANVATYVDSTGATTTTTYVYRVRATNAGGNSAFSNNASTTVP